MAVLAVAGALAMFVALTPNGAQADHVEIPGAITDLDAKADGARAIDVTWDALAGSTVDGYRIDRSTNGNTWVTHETSHSGTSYKDTGLTAGSTYYYRVFAFNLAGIGGVSPDALAQTDFPKRPGVVRSLSATATDQNTIVLTWAAPADDGGSDIVKYRIHIADPDSKDDGVIDDIASIVLNADTATGDNDRADGVVVTKDAGTTITFEELTAGTRYLIRVYAINKANLMSAQPGDTVAITTRLLVKPGAPVGQVTAVQQARVGNNESNSNFNLYWYAPTSNGGAPITGYKVEVSLNGRPYIATNAVWTNDPENSAQAAYVVPFNVPDVTPDELVTRVRFQVYSQTGAASPSTLLESATAALSDWTDVLVETQQDENLMDVNIRVDLIPAAPGFTVGANAKRDGFGNVNLIWVAPATSDDDSAPDSIGGYRIDVSDNGKDWSLLVNHTNKADPTYNYKDPAKKDRYYRIFAHHGQYLGPAQSMPVLSEPDEATASMPGHATGLTLTVVGPSQIDLSWTAPANTGGSVIDHYEVHGSLMGAAGSFVNLPMVAVVSTATDAASLLFDTSETTSYTHDELSAGQTWQYRVVPVNENDANNKAAAAAAEIRQATTHQEAMPEAPEMLVAESAKDSNSGSPNELGVLLLWNAPNAPDGAALDGYRVQRTKDGGTTWATIEDDTGSLHTDFTDSEEPVMDEIRGYRVAAISTNNIVGAYSNVAMVPQDTTHTPVVGPEVGPATGVTTGPFNAGGTIQVSWDVAPNATGYIIYAVNVDELDDANGQIVVAPVNDAAAETYNLGGLKSGDTYDIYVVATAKEMVEWPASADVQQVTAN